MKNLVNKIIRSSTRVWNTLGPGFNECVYHRALETDFRFNNISYNSEVIVPFTYLDNIVGHGRIDLLVQNKLIVELKATSSVPGDIEQIQLNKYMKFMNINHGMLVHFGQKKSGCLNIFYMGNKEDTQKYSIKQTTNNESSQTENKTADIKIDKNLYTEGKCILNMDDISLEKWSKSKQNKT